MQQRFSKNEMKKYQITTVVSTSDLKLHQWLNSVEEMGKNNKKSQFNIHNDGDV